VTIYELYHGYGEGAILVAENSHAEKSFIVDLDLSGSTNLNAMRLSLRTCDVVPPLHRSFFPQNSKIIIFIYYFNIQIF